ncbi:hypothetical protein Vretifemale_9984, partial [Volvox reticuliferus]
CFLQTTARFRLLLRVKSKHLCCTISDAPVEWILQRKRSLRLRRDVDGDDAMEASDGEPPAKRVRAHAPQAAAAAVGAGPSSASRPRQHGKRPSSGGRGNARGDRRGHQQGRGGGGVNPQSLTADQERELTRYYNRYGRQLTRGDLRDLRKEAGGNVCFCCRAAGHSYDECTLRPPEARAAAAQGNGH